MSVRYFKWVYFLLFYVTFVEASAVPSAKKSKVWGSGLESNVVLPARYFFIHAADKNGKL